MDTVSIKVDRHSKYVMDMLAADFNTETGESNTNADVLWRVFEQYLPDFTKKAEEKLGKRVKPKRGKSKNQSESESE